MMVAHGVSGQRLCCAGDSPSWGGQSAQMHTRRHGPPLGPQSPLQGLWGHLCFRWSVGLCWTRLSVQEDEMKLLGVSVVAASW